MRALPDGNEFQTGTPEENRIEQSRLREIVGAKNENIKQGIVQCIAEMVAAQQFNREQGNPIRTVSGAVTTGSIWTFLRLAEMLVTVDTSEYYLKEVERVVAILMAMLQESPS